MHQALFYKHKIILTLTTKAGFLNGQSKTSLGSNDQNWEDLRVLEYKWETV